MSSDIGGEKCLICIFEYLRNTTLQLVYGFRTETNKIRYLRNAFLGEKWATTSLKNIKTVQRNFDKPVYAPNGNIQLEYDLEKATISSKTYYGQFTTNPRDVRKYDTSQRNDSRSHRDYWSQRYNDPFRYSQRYQRERSPSAYHFQRCDSRHLSTSWVRAVQTVVFTTHAQQVVLALERDIFVRIMNIPIPIKYDMYWM